MDEERMNKKEFKERMNVWEQLWYFKSIAKTSQVSQITSSCDCMLLRHFCFTSVMLKKKKKNRLRFRLAHFVLSFKICWTDVTVDYFNTETLAEAVPQDTVA